MKSYGGNLFESIVDKDNFTVAQKLSRQGKSSRKEIRIFESNLDENLEEIRQLVINKKFHTAKYRSKKIFEPKERIIYILPYAPDRIVQHAIMNILFLTWKRCLSLTVTLALQGEDRQERV